MLSAELRLQFQGLLAVGLALVWLWAGGAKLMHPTSLQQVTAAVPWLRHVHARITTLAMRALPIAEILLALGLLPLATRPVAAVASAVLLLAFALALGSGLVFSALAQVAQSPGGADASAMAAATCGCFGRVAARVEVQATQHAVPATDQATLHTACWHVVRPLLLAAVALALRAPCACG